MSPLFYFLCGIATMLVIYRFLLIKALFKKFIKDSDIDITVKNYLLHKIDEL